MPRHHKNIERHGRSHSAAARRRVVILGTSVGAFLAFGMTLSPNAPSAHAHIDNLIVDLLDSGGWGGPGFELPGADEAVTNAALAAGSTVDPAAASADPSAIDNMFQQDFYLPFHAALENWLQSPSGQQFDNAINPMFVMPNMCGLICNGTPGAIAAPEGGHGGFFFGDGGAGYNSATAGVARGEGGAAALLGDAGAAGTAGLGADGALGAPGITGGPGQ